MPGESVLIVDDTPVNLKLADLLLRKQGFDVRAAHSAEEALSILRTFRPDLMLVDSRLEGMDGFELTRCVKMDPRTRETVAIALIATDTPAMRERAAAAGCDGCLVEPVDVSSLGATVRSFLGHHGAEPQSGPGLLPGDLDLSGPEIEAVRRNFLAAGAERARRLLEALGTGLDASAEARRVRRWMAAATALDYPGIVTAAQRLNDLLATPRPAAPALREAISDLLCSFFEPPEATTDALPDALLGPLSGRRIALTAFRPEDAERLCAALNRAGARPRLFEPGDSPGNAPVRDCALVMVQVGDATKASAWLAAEPFAPPDQPLILAGPRREIMSLDPALLARTSEFLIDGWQPEEALMRCSFALLRGIPAKRAVAAGAPSGPEAAPRARPEILIADDDPVAISFLRTTLEVYGMDCVVAHDGATALEIIRERRPDAAVLDINMPRMDGYLVLAGVREAELDVPVVLLTARDHENDIARAFTLGADDYLVKPFKAVELMARLRRLIRR